VETTIISHDTTTGNARIRFEHNGVTVEQDFSLIDVVPGSRYVFSAMGLTFDESYQQLAITKLETMIQNQIEEGVITNPPEPEIPEYTAPPEPEPEPESEPVAGE